MVVDPNALVTDALLINNEVVLGNTPAGSQGVTLESSAFSLSLLMMNAVSAQQAASQTASAAVATVCAELLRAASLRS
jgi:Killing trait